MRAARVGGSSPSGGPSGLWASARKGARNAAAQNSPSKTASLGVNLLMLIAVSLLKQPRDGVMGCAAKCELGRRPKSNYWKRLIPKYHHNGTDRPIPQIPYVETGNAGERGLQIFEPGETRRVAGGGRTPVNRNLEDEEKGGAGAGFSGPGKLGAACCAPTFRVAESELLKRNIESHRKGRGPGLSR